MLWFSQLWSTGRWVGSANGAKPERATQTTTWFCANRNSIKNMCPSLAPHFFCQIHCHGTGYIKGCIPEIGACASRKHLVGWTLQLIRLHCGLVVWTGQIFFISATHVWVTWLGNVKSSGDIVQELLEICILHCVFAGRMLRGPSIILESTGTEMWTPWARFRSLCPDPSFAHSDHVKTKKMVLHRHLRNVGFESRALFTFQSRWQPNHLCPKISGTRERQRLSFVA